MKTEKLDGATAWLELARFASVCGVELDERAHPEYKPPDDTDEEKERAEKLDEDAEPVGENKVSNYDTIMDAIRSGHVTVSEGGALTIYWIKPPWKAELFMELDPEADDGNGWPYSEATRALHMVPIAPPVSTRARKRTPDREDDQLGRMDRFLEVLSGQKKGTMLKLNHRKDRDLVSSLTQFILLE